MTLAPGAGPARAHSTLREWAYPQLREMIVAGVPPPGAEIHEGQLRAHLGISRSPLCGHSASSPRRGWLWPRRSAGSSVAPFSPEDIAEIDSLRSYVEARDVRLATARATDDDVRALRANIAAMEECARRGDHRGFVERDAEFHRLLARIADHSRLLRVQRGLQADMLRLMMYHPAGAGNAAVTDASIMHRAIVDAVEAGQPDAAERLMREHLHRGEMLRRQMVAGPDREPEPVGSAGS
jgi:DNA-binding GntR family transcriptional regulator